MDNFSREFEEFLRSKPETPSARTSASIRDKVARRLEPSPFAVAAKLSGSVVLGAAFTLLFCPQFNVSVTHYSIGVMEFFMRHGPIVCTAACAAFSLFIGGLLGAALLTREELRIARKHRLFSIAAPCMLTLGALVCAGAQIVLTAALIWLAGAALGLQASFEIHQKSRTPTI